MKIDTSIGKPRSSAGAPRKYPFADMGVGDSIFFHGERIGTSCKPYLAAQQIGLRAGMKFSGRTVDGGVRIWRIA